LYANIEKFVSEVIMTKSEFFELCPKEQKEVRRFILMTIVGSVIGMTGVLVAVVALMQR
jgi:hypothetical protein